MFGYFNKGGFYMENNLSFTQKFAPSDISNKKIENTIKAVKNAMLEKGYNPVNQMVGYILSGDPTYITSHNSARSIITEIEKNELLEEFIKYYLNKF